MGYAASSVKKTHTFAIFAFFAVQKRNLMNFNAYQKKSRKTAKYPAIGHAVICPALG